MGRAESSLPSRVTTLEADNRHTQDRLSSIDALASDMSALKERTARLEEWREVKGEQAETGIASSTLLWTKIGVGVAIALGAIGIFLALVLR